MRKPYIVIVLLSLPFLAASSCGGEPQKCVPHTIRQDTYQPKRFWVCKDDGSGETPYISPTPSSNPIDT